MKHRIFKEIGFSLIEVVVAVAVFVIVILGFFGLYDGYIRTFNTQQAQFIVTTSASALMNEVTTMVLQADRVLSAHTFSGTAYTSGASSLVLELPAIDSSGNILTGHDYVVFYVSGNAAYRLFEADAASNRRSGLKQLSDAVNSLIFTYDNIDVTQATKVDTQIETRIQTGHHQR